MPTNQQNPPATSSIQRSTRRTGVIISSGPTYQALSIPLGGAGRVSGSIRLYDVGAALPDPGQVGLVFYTSNTLIDDANWLAASATLDQLIDALSIPSTWGAVYDNYGDGSDLFYDFSYSCSGAFFVAVVTFAAIYADARQMNYVLSLNATTG